MKKNFATKRIKVKAESKIPKEKTDTETSDEPHDEMSTSNNIFRCPECCNIPLINVKDNENRVIIDCLKGHHREMLFSEFITNELEKNDNKLVCSECGNSEKEVYKICEECSKMFCKNCKNSHFKKFPEHHLISYQKADNFCPFHKLKFTNYCEQCKKNLCDECVNEHPIENHHLFLFETISASKEELEEIKYQLLKENDILHKVKKIFNDTLNTLTNKFNDIISYKFLCLKFKNMIVNNYEQKDSNYQVIDNLNRLKYITEDVKIEPEMNELDIIYELFNFLDSVEYNDTENNQPEKIEENEHEYDEDESAREKNENDGSEVYKSKEIMIKEGNGERNDNGEDFVNNENNENNENNNNIANNNIANNNNKDINKEDFENNEDKDESKEAEIENNNNNEENNNNANVNNDNKENQNPEKNEIEKSDNNENNNSNNKNNENSESSENNDNIHNKETYENDDTNKNNKKIDDKILNEKDRDDESFRYKIKVDKKNNNNDYNKENINVNSEKSNEDISNPENSSEQTNPKIVNKEIKNEKINSNEENDEEEVKPRKKKLPKKIIKKKINIDKKVQNENPAIITTTTTTTTMMAAKKKVRKRNKSKDEKAEEFHSDEDENIGTSSRNTMNYKVNSDFSQIEIPNTNIEESNETQNKPTKVIKKKKKKKIIVTKKKIPIEDNVNKNDNEENIEIKKPKKLKTKENLNIDDENYNENENVPINKKVKSIRTFNDNNNLNDDENNIPLSARKEKALPVNKSKKNINNTTGNESLKKKKRIVKKKILDELNKVENEIEDEFHFEKNKDNNEINNDEEEEKPKHRIKKKKKKIISKVNLAKKEVEFPDSENEKENINNKRIEKDEDEEQKNSSKKRKIKKIKNLKQSAEDEEPNTNKELYSKKKIATTSSQNKKLKVAQNKNTTAILYEKNTEIYLDEKALKKLSPKKKNNKDTLINNIDAIEFDYTKSNLNRSMEGFNPYHHGYDEEIGILKERSNSFKKMRNFVKFNTREKINSIKFENGISCILEINQNIFGIGNLIGDLIILNSKSLREIQTIREHNGTIISLCLLQDKGILSSSADRTMKKIRLSPNGEKYIVEFVFSGYDNYILKGIELMNTFKIITCSWDDKLYVWERESATQYENSLIFNNGERVQDLLEINAKCFVSISDNNDLKFWNSKSFKTTNTVSNIKCIGAPNALCKLNECILCVLDYHEIQLVDLNEKKLINTITVEDGNLSCIIKLNDSSLLVAEDFNTDTYCVFYMKQFFYDNGDLQPVSYKKDKFYKSNKNNDKEIRALTQFSNGVIVQGVTGEYNGKDSGDLFFYY